MFARFAAALALAALTTPTLAATVIDGVTVIDPRTGKLQLNRAILIDGTRIIRIGRAGSIAADIKVDARGKFVVPGFLDMHAHPLNEGHPETSLPLMVAYGVTGYRQMAGSDELLAERKAGKLPATSPMPEPLLMTGQVLAGPFAADPAAAVVESKKQIAEGADFVKVVDLRPEAFAAVAAAAKAAGKPFAGHLPATVDIKDAAALGMRAIEHLGGGNTVIEACSSDYAAILAGHRAVPSPKLNFSIPPAVLRKLISNPSMLVDAKSYDLQRHALDTYDETTCRRVARLLKAHGVWQVPTLIRDKTIDFGDAAEFANNPDLQYAGADERALWTEVSGMFAKITKPETRQLLAAIYARDEKIVKLFDEEGVPMLAGTDFGGQWIVAGASLHTEFDLLAHAGLSPLRILQMTTIDGARFLGREKTMGTVEAGKQADLVLLDANPVAAVANLHGIAGVVRAGTYYSPDVLADIKRRVAAQ